MDDQDTERAESRAAEARQRIADLEERRRRLRDSHGSTEEDVTAALAAAEQAERRAHESHLRAAEAHRRAARLAEDLGHLEDAARHRTAAEADDAESNG